MFVSLCLIPHFHIIMGQRYGLLDQNCPLSPKAKPALSAFLFLHYLLFPTFRGGSGTLLFFLLSARILNVRRRHVKKQRLNRYWPKFWRVDDEIVKIGPIRRVLVETFDDRNGTYGFGYFRFCGFNSKILDFDESTVLSYKTFEELPYCINLILRDFDVQRLICTSGGVFSRGRVVQDIQGTGKEG